MSIGFDRVHFAYGDTPVLINFSLQLPSNGMVCLWGPSGCGKTTLLRLLAGLEKPLAGTVHTPQHVSVVFQENRLLPWYTVAQNVCLPGCSPVEAENYLRQLGLEELGDRLPEELSGGQQRRVALARALANPGDLLLLDEPFTGLDEETWRNIVPLIAACADKRLVVLVTHVGQQADALNAEIIPLTGLAHDHDEKNAEIL